MVRPELLHLNFDACERLSAISDALVAAGIRADDVVLDVGGHPGLLASTLEGRCRVVTADFPPTGRLPYLRASGDALPFRSGSFAAVVASDTLEHVPPAARERFLREMWRVARRLVLVGGPYATPGVPHAEACLRKVEAAVRAIPDRWLAEHAEHGLPRLDQTWRVFESEGARVAALPNGDLLRWFILFTGRIVLEDLPGGTDAVDDFMPAYNRLLGPLPPASDSPTYRHLVIAVKDATSLEIFAKRPLLMASAAIPGEDAGEEHAVRERLDALTALFQSLSGALCQQTTRTESGGALESGYIEQLERALRQQNERLEQLQAQLARVTAPPGILRRLARKLRAGSGTR